MKAADIREMTDEELVEQLSEAKAELFNLRFQLATAQLDNPLRIRDVRKDIARIQSIRKQRELAAKDQAEEA